MIPRNHFLSFIILIAVLLSLTLPSTYVNCPIDKNDVPAIMKQKSFLQKDPCYIELKSPLVVALPDLDLSSSVRIRIMAEKIQETCDETLCPLIALVTLVLAALALIGSIYYKLRKKSDIVIVSAANSYRRRNSQKEILPNFQPASIIKHRCPSPREINEEDQQRTAQFMWNKQIAEISSKRVNYGFQLGNVEQQSEERNDSHFQ